MPIIYIAIAIALSACFAGSAKAAQPEPQKDDVTTASPPANTEPFDRQRFQKEVIERKDLPNYHEVHPYLFRSGEPTEQGMKEIRQKGINTIIDLRAKSERKGDEPSWAKQLGIKYINLPMTSEAPTKRQVDTFMHTVKQAQDHPEDGSVLVHCAHGSDRTGCMVGIWRVSEDGWTYDQAYKEMRKYWFGPKFTNLSGAVEKYAAKSR